MKTLPELKPIHTDGKLDHDIIEGALRVEKLKAGRHVDDIPLDDEYWKSLAYHNRALEMNKK